MLTLNTLALLLAQTSTETGKTNQTSWQLVIIALLIVGFVAVAVFVRRSRRAHGEPPAGSVPASEVPGYLNSGRMSTPEEVRRRD